MIDGLGQKKKDEVINAHTPPADTIEMADRNSKYTASGSRNLHSAAKVGLSSSGHGYNAVANLAHAVFLLSGARHIVFLIQLRDTRGYFVPSPTGNLRDRSDAVNTTGTPTNLKDVMQPQLDAAGLYVTLCVIVINVLMLLRFLYEKCRCSRHESGLKPDLSETLSQALLADSEPEFGGSE